MQRVRRLTPSALASPPLQCADPGGYSRRRALRVAGATIAAGVATAVGPRLVGAAAGAQPGVYFPETGQTVALDFAQFWLDSGGENLFGLPITSEYEENGIRMQWFERARFERWPDQRGVVLPLLGDEYLASTGRSATIQPNAAVTTPDVTVAGQYFPETGFTVDEPFLSFFHRHGGVAIFGYPIGERQVVGNVPAQYFQRARFELHRDGVRLARLGIAVAELQGHQPEPVPQHPFSMDWHELVESERGPDVDVALAVHADAMFEMERHVAGANPTTYWNQLPWLAVSLDRQRATAFVGAEPVFTDLVSTGLEGKGLTPPGLYTINYRVYNEVMDSATLGLPQGHPLYYRLDNVLYTQYFTTEGHAIHYAWWHDNFGVPMSFGCVNMRLSTARFFWQWAGIGTPILIHE